MLRKIVIPLLGPGDHVMGAELVQCHRQGGEDTRKRTEDECGNDEMEKLIFQSFHGFRFHIAAPFLCSYGSIIAYPVELRKSFGEMQAIFLLFDY